MAVNLEYMSLDEVIEHRLKLKKKKEDLQKELNAGKDAYDRKVREAHWQEAVTQLTKAAEKNGLTIDEQAQNWLTESSNDLGHEVQARLYLGMARVGRG